jgi:NADH-quinone oxidoreductase subunit M
MVTSVLVSWQAIEDRAALFYAMLLLLEFGCLGVFCARDIILFYVFFEFTLIPLFFLIGIWGSEQRRYAAQKFFVYTLAGSLLTFLALLGIVLWVYQSTRQLTFSIPELTRLLADHPIEPLSWQIAIFLGLFAGFAIKVPLFPLHTWLPLAHVQAPTAGSVFLAGILLKIGTYGFLRFNVAMLPDATAALAPWMLWLAVLGIIYGALVALAQRDIKRLIAYSSVSHLGYCVLGIFALNRLGVQGGALQMINHGISTGALFALVGMLYERYHTREISQYSGLARRLPWLAFFMLVFTFSSIGLPGLNGFAGEFLILVGMFQMAWGQSAATEGLQQYRIISVLAVTGVVLGAWYMLWMIQRVFFGPLREPHDVEGTEVKDLNGREVLALAPLAVLVVWIGIQPTFFLQRMGPSLDRLTTPARVMWQDQQVTSGQSPVMQQVSTSGDAQREASERVR